LAVPGADGITFIKQAEDFGLLKDVTVGFLGFSEAYLGAFGKGKGENMWVTVPLVSSSDDAGVKDFVARIRKNDERISRFDQKPRRTEKYFEGRGRRIS